MTKPTLEDWAIHNTHTNRGSKTKMTELAKELTEKFGHEFQAFKCKVCKNYHVGRVNK